MSNIYIKIEDGDNRLVIDGPLHLLKKLFFIDKPAVLGMAEIAGQPAEDKRYPIEDWVYEMQNGDTILHYWPWVQHKLDAEPSVEEEVQRLVESWMDKEGYTDDDVVKATFEATASIRANMSTIVDISPNMTPEQVEEMAEFIFGELEGSHFEPDASYWTPSSRYLTYSQTELSMMNTAGSRTNY